MMANKALLFEDQKCFEKIIEAAAPIEAKQLGRKVMGFDDDIWNEHKHQIVKRGNIYKFNQHPAYVDFLLKTDDRILVEASPYDIIWGIGLTADHPDANIPSDWLGENLLGFALMEVRDFFKEFGHFQYVLPKCELPWKRYPKIDPRDIFGEWAQERI